MIFPPQGENSLTSKHVLGEWESEGSWVEFRHSEYDNYPPPALIHLVKSNEMDKSMNGNS